MTGARADLGGEQGQSKDSDAGIAKLIWLSPDRRQAAMPARPFHFFVAVALVYILATAVICCSGLLVGH
ncbi:MAG: hypothetical protein P4L83_17755 [Nevskia sp.]|nr:hypothetical protein [Nevskia sp.]